MLPLKGSNLHSPGPKPDVLPITPKGTIFKKGNGLGGKSDHNQLLMLFTALKISPNIYYPAKDFVHISLYITKLP